MSQHYSNPARESEETALPDIEVFQLTAHEVAASMEDEGCEARKRFPMCDFNSRDRERALDWIVQEYNVQGGWFWHACFPGCLPDSDSNGPFATKAQALADAQDCNDCP